MWSEREVRVAELEAGGAVASAELGRLPDGRPRLRRADLVLMPREPSGRRPVAVEVELAVKWARRLEAICRAWARCRLVDRVRYYASPAAARAVARAVERVQAHDVIEIHSLDETLKGETDVTRVRKGRRLSTPPACSSISPLVIAAGVVVCLIVLLVMRVCGLHWSWTAPTRPGGGAGVDGRSLRRGRRGLRDRRWSR